MFENHAECIASSIDRCIEKVGIQAIADDFFEDFFRKFPETIKYFDNTDIKSFGPRKFKIISDFVIDTLKHPEYAETQMMTEVFRHTMYGLVDQTYYTELLESLKDSVKKFLADEWTEEMNEYWQDSSTALKASIQQGAHLFLA